MNSLQKKGLLALGILSLAVFVGMFTNAIHIAHAASTSPSQAAACSTTSGAPGDPEVVQQGDCQGQFGDQTTPDIGTSSAEPAESGLED